MRKKNIRILWTSAGYWFLLNSVLLLSSLAVPNPVDLIYYVTCSIYFALSLIALRIYKSEQFNKDIFLNISLLFGLMALTEIPGFRSVIGDLPAAEFHIYQQVVVTVFGFFTVIFYVLKYLVSWRMSLQHWGVSGAITLVVCALNYFLFFSRPTVLTHAEYSLVMLNLRIFMGVFFALYAIKVYRYDTPTGEYLHLLLVGLFFWVLRQTIDNFSNAFNIFYFQENKYLELFNIIIILVILLKKLNYSTSDFGRIYEQIIYNHLKINDLKIQRRGRSNLKYLVEVGHNFFQTPKSFPFVCVLFGTPGFFSISFYQVLNFSVNFLFILFLFLFTVQLHQKRLGKNYIIQ